jgi:hypothetical protein
MLPDPQHPCLTPNTQDIDLSNDALFDLPGEELEGFGDEHSGQFNARIQNLKAFYNALLQAFEIPLAQ